MKIRPYLCCPPLARAFCANLVLALVILVLSSFTAGAAFSGSWLEPFNGTEIDTATWRPIRPDLISQNDALFFAGSDYPGTVTEVIANEVALGIGGVAQVQVSVQALTTTPNYTSSAYLALTTDSSGFGVPWDSYGLIAELNAKAPYSGFIASTTISVTNIAPTKLFPVSLDTTYSLRLERLSDTTVRYTVFNASNFALAMITRTLPSYADPLYLALGARSVDATFDNLQLAGTVIPEPATSTLLGLGALALVTGRRRA